MPVPHAVPPTIRTDADRRAFEAGRRAGLAVAAIVRERVEDAGAAPEEPEDDPAGAAAAPPIPEFWDFRPQRPA
jgi:hypothetical protein